MNLDKSDRQRLIDLAWQSIRHGLQHGKPKSAPTDLGATLLTPGATFVTLEYRGELRGCIGSLEAWRPLAEDVCQNAFAAAFRDPRFAPLQAHELEQLTLQISVLTPPVPIQFQDEADLRRQLVPGEDGLLLEDGTHRGTFLPQVWEQLPTPKQFLDHLKNKAGLPANYWSPSLRVLRYHVEKFD